jgi:PiT family inorganic phosphate transporter
MQSLQIALWVVVMLVALALVFDFMNGFHDAANSIATVVSTGVLKPGQAVAFAAFFNVVAIFLELLIASFSSSVALAAWPGIKMSASSKMKIVAGSTMPFLRRR